MNYNSEKNYKPKVSVIVPTYRRDDRLEKALESLMNQTYKELEIIVVSDNADNIWDNKIKEIVSSFKSKSNGIEIKLILNQINLKSALSRNVGISCATGEYITFLDDDDYYMPSKVESQVLKMIKDNSDFSITNLELYTYSGKNIDSRRRKGIEKYIVNNNLMTYHLKFHLAGTDTLMFKSSYLNKIGGFEKNEVGDEFLLMYKSIKNGGKFSYYNECHIHALVHKDKGGISSGFSKINRENNLYEFKKNLQQDLKKKDFKYIRSRHHATLGYAYLRMKRIAPFLKHAFLSLVISPISAFSILFNR